MGTEPTLIASSNAVENCIYLIRRQKVMLDSDLAKLYGVELRALVQAVKRNVERFPPDFVFQLNAEEYRSLRSQSVILENQGRGKYRKYLPYVFSEQGISMLSGVLRSPQAVQVHIAIMRAFVRMRRLLLTNEVLAKKLEELDAKLIGHDNQIREIIKAIRSLMNRGLKPVPKIGYLRS